MNYLGNRLRELRESKGLLLRQVAAHIEVDTALVSKLERGERKAHKDQVLQIAVFLEAEEKELMLLWIADNHIIVYLARRNHGNLFYRQPTFALVPGGVWHGRRNSVGRYFYFSARGGG